MRVTHDKEANAVYVYIREGEGVVRTETVHNTISSMVNVDYNELGQVIGFEVLEK